MSQNINEVFIARQPILDSKQDIFGYELFSRSSQNNDKSEIEHTAKSDSEMLFNILSTFDIDSLLGGKIAFLNCTLESLSLDIFDIVSPKSVVLEVQRPLHETAEVAQEISEKMKALVSKGYVIASDDFILDTLYANSLEYVKYIKFQADKINTKEAVNRIIRANSLGKKIVAEKVETQSQFEFLKKLSVVSYFQGYFFYKPVTMSAKITNPATISLVRLMNMVVRQDDVKNMEEVFKTDPSLSFKLLRYINSAGFGLSTKVSSFKHAIMLLGHKPLLKWLSVLFSTVNKNPGADAISKAAVTRACFMELLASKKLTKAESDNSFIVGMFSLLEAMLQVPLVVSLGSINLPTEITDALLHGKGIYAPLLNLTLAVEQDDWIEVFATAHVLGLTPLDVSENYLEAMKNAQEIGM
jgi:c-di-GMP-related signal transduction protein